MSRAKAPRKCWDIPATTQPVDPHRATADWDPATFVLVDIAALEGAERDLVTSMFEHHTAAAQTVMDDLARDHAMPVMRARMIMQSCMMMLTAIDAHQMRLTQGTFAEAATSALAMAGDLLDVASDIQGEA